MVKLNLNKEKPFTKDLAEKEFLKILEEFELDLLECVPEKENVTDGLKKMLVPVIMRGRLDVDFENIKITLKLKKPVKVTVNDSETYIEELTFSVDNCELNKMSKMEEKAKRAEYKEIITTFAGAETSGINEKVVGKFCHHDYSVAGSICSLFLAF